MVMFSMLSLVVHASAPVHANSRARRGRPAIVGACHARIPPVSSRKDVVLGQGEPVFKIEPLR